MGEHGEQSIACVGVIRYVDSVGCTREWRVGAHRELDTPDTLHDHLLRWKPDAKFIEAYIVLDD